MEYIIGVDAGGTKTCAAAYSLEGNLLLTETTSFGSVVIDKNKALINMKKAVDKCMNTLIEGKCKGIVIGAAGAETGNAIQEITNYFRNYYETKIIVTNDAELAMYAYLKGHDGILLISGTGSIAYGKKGQNIERCGGWGHLIDDGGSGYYIVMEAIRHIVKEQDERKKTSNLSKMILDYLEINEIKHLINFVYTSKKGEIAALAPVIVKEAKNGDQDAIDILIKSGDKLFQMILTLYRRLHFNKGYITFSGSIMNIEIIKENVINNINKEMSDMEILKSTCAPTIGGYYIYMENKEEQERP